MVVAEQVDCNGNWIPSQFHSLATTAELVTELKKYLDTGEPVVIHAPAGFHNLATELGLPLLRGEWGLL